MEQTLAVLREAQALAEALDDPRRLGQIAVFLSVHFHFSGAYAQAIAAAERALALATAGGEVVLQALAHHYLGFAYWAQGDYRRALDCCGATVVALDGPRRYEHFGFGVPPAVGSHALLAWCHAELGLFAEGRACGEAGLQIAETVARRASLRWACWGMGVLCLRQGDLPRALPLLERAVALCEDTNVTYFPLLASALSAAYTMAGRRADAVPLLTRAMAQTTATHPVDFPVLRPLALGEAQLLAGHLAEASTLVAQALTRAHAHQERGHQAYALCLLGAIAARRDPPDGEAVVAYYRPALTLADELGMRPLGPTATTGWVRCTPRVARRSRPVLSCRQLSSCIRQWR